MAGYTRQSRPTDEDQAREAFRLLVQEHEGGKEDDGSTQRVTDQGEIVQILLEDGPVEELGLVHGRVPVVTGLRRCPESLHLDQDHTPGLGQLWNPVAPGVGVSPQPVDQEDRLSRVTVGLHMEGKLQTLL
jgi:hypothetical protein